MRDRTKPRSSRGDAARILHVLMQFTPRARRSMIAIGVLSFLSGLAEAGILVSVTAVAVSATATGDRNTTLGPVTLTPREIVGVGGAMLVANIALSIVLARLAATTSTNASIKARQDLLSAFHRASYQRKSEDRVAALQEALTTYVDRFTLGFGSLTALVASALNLASFAIAAVVVSPLASIALAVIGGLMMAVLRPTTRRTRSAGRALATQRRAYAEGATESVLLARELSVFGVDGVAGSRLATLDLAVGADYWRLRYLSMLTPRIYQALAFGVALAGLFVLTGIKAENLTAVGAVALLLVRSLSHGQAVLTSLQQQSEHRPYVDRLLDMLESYEAEPRHTGSEPTGTIEQIRFRSVGFAYRDGTTALQGLEFDLAAGETLGVVGPSGAGKSTLVNLLLRLNEPTEGSILVNDVPLREVLDSEWHRRTAIVPQDPRLIHGTIADNIRFLRDLPQAAVEQAAAEANIADFIESLKLGYDAPVGELGIGLSGGQRQRLCIARALAGQPDLLVLDEPTSALDGESEAAIQRTLEGLQGRVTMVVVAHRLSTLTICDRLLILRQGEQAGIGTAEELAESSSYYREALRLAGL